MTTKTTRRRFRFKAYANGAGGITVEQSGPLPKDCNWMLLRDTKHADALIAAVKRGKAEWRAMRRARRALVRQVSEECSLERFAEHFDVLLAMPRDNDVPPNR
jgi:hypothetical protein